MHTSATFAFLLAGIAAALTPVGASAQVYKCQQDSGLMTYSDKPCHIKTTLSDVKSIDKVEDELPTAATLLRALGPDKAIDKSGKVYTRVTGGYVDKHGLRISGVAQGHR
jgi:hypothetical protein